MQSTNPSHLPATPHLHFSLPTSSLLQAFSSIPDPRRRQGTRYPLPAVLSLAVAAILSNHLSLLAIAEWGHDLSPDLKRALGFPKNRTPHVSTLQRLFQRLDPPALASALQDYFDPSLPGQVPARGSEGVAIDGKALRGRLPHEPKRTHPVHTVSAFSHDLGVVLAQIAVQSQLHQGELTVVPTLIEQCSWQGRVLTGDALYCQRKLCAQVVEAEGDYLVLVDDNQPTLKADIEQVFAPPPPLAPGHGEIVMEEQQAQTVDKGHGRLEVREIRVSSELREYLDWPSLEQVFEVRRTWKEKGVEREQVRYGLTSLPQAIAGPERLLELKRGHWGVENRLHWVKDEVLGEDRSQLQRGTGAEVMAMVRSCAVSCLRRAGKHQIASSLRSNSRKAEVVLGLLGIPIG
jgi:predicted transposase YbfD/YdcC